MKKTLSARKVTRIACRRAGMFSGPRIQPGRAYGGILGAGALILGGPAALPLAVAIVGAGIVSEAEERNRKLNKSAKRAAAPTPKQPKPKAPAKPRRARKARKPKVGVGTSRCPITGRPIEPLIPVISEA